MMRNVWVLLVLGLVFCSIAGAEMRIWSDKKGNTIEAEFMGMMGSKVMLKTPEGKTMKVPASGLCEADKKFLAENIPPKIEIEVDVDKDRDTLSSQSSTYGTYSYERKSETITCSIDIKKTNREECNRAFKAYIYVFGENLESKRMRVLDISEKEFDFKARKTTSFRSEPVTMEYSDSSHWGKDGYRYCGYLVFIEDDKKQVVEVKSTKSGFESNLAAIRKAEEGSLLDSNYNVVKKSNNRRVY